MKNLRKFLTTVVLCAFAVGVSLVPLNRAEAFTLNYTIKRPNYSTTSQQNYNTGNQNSSQYSESSNNNTTTNNQNNSQGQTSKPATTAPTEPTSVAIPTGLTADEATMVKLVNQERTKAGLKPLEVDLRLVQTARAKSQDMVKNNYFSHTSPTYGTPYQQMKAAGITGYSVLGGENIAGNSSVQNAHTSLMNSAGHRANILDPRYTHIGIGIVDGGPYGKMITQHFAGNY